MIIVIEGPDGSGKSTLGDTLAKKYNGIYRHSGGQILSEKDFNNRIKILFLNKLNNIAKAIFLNFYNNKNWKCKHIGMFI